MTRPQGDGSEISWSVERLCALAQVSRAAFYRRCNIGGHNTYLARSAALNQPSANSAKRNTAAGFVFSQESVFQIGPAPQLAHDRAGIFHAIAPDNAATPGENGGLIGRFRNSGGMTSIASPRGP